MINELRALAIFAEVSKQGSFIAAAKVLGLSPSVVSYQISQLEQKVGVTLLYRSTRHLSLSPQGEVLYQHALAMQDAALAGLNLINQDITQLRGKLSISLPTALINSDISRKIAMFCQQHSQLFVNLAYTDDRQNLIAEGIDLAIRAGQMTSSSLKARRIGEIKRRLVAHRDLVNLHPTVTEPEQLCSWHWISLSMLPHCRTLVSVDGKKVVVNYQSRVSVNSVQAMTELTIAGLGLSTPPDYLVADALAGGELVEVLPSWRVEPVPLYGVWPENLSQYSAAYQLVVYLADGASTLS